MKKSGMIFWVILFLIPFFSLPAHAAPVVLDMDVLPNAAGWTYSGYFGSVSGGILTIRTDPGLGAMSYLTYYLTDANADWVMNGNNQRGWVVEARLQVDPASLNTPPYPNIGMWIDDGVYRNIIAIDTDRVFIQDPAVAAFPFNTTNGFHTYRIEGREETLRLFIDGNLAIDYRGPREASTGKPNLAFGDGNGIGFSLSYWDYLAYDTDPAFFTTGKVVGESETKEALSYPFQRKGFFANGLDWVFYSDGQDMVFHTSQGGVNWSAPTEVRAATSGEQFSVWFDGTYVHYAFADGLPGHSVYYRRGVPNADGTITWSTSSEQEAVAKNLKMRYLVPCIAVDSDGYPWIGYRRVDAANNKFPDITKSSSNNGNWTTAKGFPYDLEIWTAAYWVAAPIPLTQGKMLAIFSSHGHYLRAKSWNGTAWSQLATSTGINHTRYAVTSAYFSAVAKGDEVHIVFLSGKDIHYTRYDFAYNWFNLILFYPGTFIPEPVIQSGLTESSAPVLGLDPAGDLDLYYAGAPATNHIYYKKVSGGYPDSEYPLIWTMTGPIDLVDESQEKLSSNSSLSTFHLAAPSGKSLFYLTKPSSPYKVKFFTEDLAQ